MTYFCVRLSDDGIYATAVAQEKPGRAKKDHYWIDEWELEQAILKCMTEPVEEEFHNMLLCFPSRVDLDKIEDAKEYIRSVAHERPKSWLTRILNRSKC